MSTKDYTIVITTGRNVGNEPMSCYHWVMFRGEVARLLSFTVPTNIIQRPPFDVDQGQQGTWEGTVEEQADTWVALGTLREQDVQMVKRELSSIAREYKQAAIGCILVEGHSHMVWAY